MRRFIHHIFFFSLLFPFCFVFSQEKASGPAINDFGEVYRVDDPDFKVELSTELKAVFDIMNSPESHEEINASIETAARFLNMHGQSGVPSANLKAAIVVHNTASKDIMTDGAYQKKYGTRNPNTKLIKALLDAGVQVIFCGQSAAARGIPKEDLIDGVQMSLSAMNALIQLQDDNYRLIKF